MEVINLPEQGHLMTAPTGSKRRLWNVILFKKKRDEDKKSGASHRSLLTTPTFSTAGQMSLSKDKGVIEQASTVSNAKKLLSDFPLL